MAAENGVMCDGITVKKNSESFADKVNEAKLRWFGHVLRSTDSRNVSTLNSLLVTES